MSTVDVAVLTFLLNTGWQVPVLALVAAVLALGLRRAQARCAFALWAGALFLSVALPAASSYVALSQRPAGAATALAGENTRANPLPPAPAGSFAAAAAGAVASVIEIGAAARSAVAAQAASAAAMRWLMAIWLLSSAWSALALCRAVLRAAELRAHSMPLPPDAPASIVARRLGHGAGAELLTTGAAVGPLTLGVRRPAILLPADWLATADPRQLEGVLAHELAHVERHDLLLHLAARLLLIPLAFHPAAWFLARRLAAARELACDELAAARTGRVAYARALLETAGWLATHSRPATTLGVHDPRLLEVRMRRLVEGLPIWNLRRSLGALSLATIGLALAAAAAAAGTIGVEPAAAAIGHGDRFAGVWRGRFDEGDGSGLPGATLTIAMLDGQPRTALLMHRHVKNPDGTMSSTATGLPIVEQRIEGDTLFLRTREDGFQFRGGPPTAVDIRWSLTLTADGEGELRVLENSYFAPAKARGESVPPPPPPMRMRRAGRSSQGGVVTREP